MSPTKSSDLSACMVSVCCQHRSHYQKSNTYNIRSLTILFVQYMLLLYCTDQEFLTLLWQHIRTARNTELIAIKTNASCAV